MNTPQRFFFVAGLAMASLVGNKIILNEKGLQSTGMQASRFGYLGRACNETYQGNNFYGNEKAQLLPYAAIITHTQNGCTYVLCSIFTGQGRSMAGFSLLLKAGIERLEPPKKAGLV